jgi:hypothetical protein
MKPMTEEHLAILRRHMVEVIAIQTDLMGDELGKPALDQRVLTVMGRVPRHLFVPLPLAPHAYRNSPLPIGFDKTISQPFIVALMTLNPAVVLTRAKDLAPLCNCGLRFRRAQGALAGSADDHAGTDAVLH